MKIRLEKNSGLHWEDSFQIYFTLTTEPESNNYCNFECLSLFVSCASFALEHNFLLCDDFCRCMCHMTSLNIDCEIFIFCRLFTAWEE